MARNRLNREELKKLNWMTEIKRQLQFKLKSIDLYMELWKNEALTKKGFDMTDPHEINLETGVIKRVKQLEFEEDGTEGN